MSARQNPSRFAVLITIVAVASLLAAACSSDNNSSGDDSSSSSNSRAELTGDPIKLLAILDEDEAVGFSQDAGRDGLTAAVNAVNDAGGVKGRPVEVDVCSSKFQAQEAELCARRAVDDGYLAVVGSVHNFGDVVNPILEEAGLVSFGNFPVALGDFMSPISFPLAAGSITNAGSMALAADVVDATEIKIGLLDVPGAEQAAILGEFALEPRGLEVAGSVPIPQDKPDLAAEAAELSSGSDAIVPIVDPATFVRLIDALAQQANTVPIVSSGSTAPNSALRDLGDDAEGIYVAAAYATDDMPGEWVKDSVEQILAFDPDAATDDVAKNSWLSVTLLAEFLEALDTIDGASLRSALDAASAVDTHGLTPIMDFTTPSTTLDGLVPRLFNGTTVYARWADDELTAIEPDFMDPFVVPE